MVRVITAKLDVLRDEVGLLLTLAATSFICITLALDFGRFSKDGRPGETAGLTSPVRSVLSF